jgi:hypothetical protein
MEDAVAGYFQEVTEARHMLGCRYHDIKTGRVKPVDGGAFFESLRQGEDELLKNRCCEINTGQGFILRPGAAQDIPDIREFVLEDNPLTARRPDSSGRVVR